MGTAGFQAKLIQRLLSYSTTTNIDFLDIEDCSSHLRATYRDYARLKEGPFRSQIARALETINQRRDGNTKTSDMNRALTSMYSAASTKRVEVAAPSDGAAAKPGETEATPSAVETGTELRPLDEDIHPGKSDDGDGSNVQRDVVGTTRAKSTRMTPSRHHSKRQRTGIGRRPVGGSSSLSASVPLPVKYEDLAGIEDVLDDVRELIEYPLKHPEVYQWLGVDPPRGVLLHGPPGCGKTALANAIANECGVPFLKISAPEIVSGMSGESEAKIRSLFQEAASMAPCIVFLDEIDAIVPKRDTAQREMERRIVAQMLTCLDDLASLGQPSDPPRAASSAPLEVSADESKGTAQDDVESLHTLPAETAKDADIEQSVSLAHKHVVVIGATNRPDSLDPALRRAGRFDREISLGIPSEASRESILRVLARRLRLSGDFDFRDLAKRTPGFVGADLAALIKEAAALAVKRIFDSLEGERAQHLDQLWPKEERDEAMREASEAFDMVDDGPCLSSQKHDDSAVEYKAPSESTYTAQPNARTPTTEKEKRLGRGPLTPTELQGLAIQMKDFQDAIKKVQPSVRREGFSTTPDVSWEDVGSLRDIRDELSFAITQPIARPELFEAMGLRSATGVLLFGPPGCGKTLVAKAAANESGANFISIKGPELLNKYVGESEKAVRQLFARARAAAPCVLFFDEMDALAPRRGSDGGNASAERLVNQLLTEMDGIDGRQGVYLIAATNRPDIIDPALLRPGRLDKMLYVPLPPAEGRVSILKTLTRHTPLSSDVELERIGMSPSLDGFSGADLAALVREACVAALKASFKNLEHNDTNTTGAAIRESDMDLQNTSSALRPTAYVTPQHFEMALQNVQPSVSKKDQRMYDALRLKLRSSRGHLKREEAGEDGPGDGDGMAIS